MYIEPNTIVRVIRDCPLEPNYEHTLYWDFNNPSAQVNYFNSITKYTFTRQTYQRVRKGAIRVERKAEDLYDCNYLAFQNTSFGSKWFYAFITSVEYVNNAVSEITFEIDVMQTWFFEAEIKDCFVEREHPVTDEIGENLLPEDVELGEYIVSSYDNTNLLAQLSIVVAATFDNEVHKFYGGYFAGVFGGLYYTVFPNTKEGAYKCEVFLHSAASQSDGIVSVFLMPTAMVTAMNEQPHEYERSWSKPVKGSAIGTYTPRNRKLYTYPYNFLYVSNLQGSACAYPYEYFDGSNCVFTVVGDMTPNPVVCMIPRDYKGATLNIDERLTLGGYPQLSFATDTFRAWLAQNAASFATTAVGAAIAEKGVTAVKAGAGAATLAALGVSAPALAAAAPGVIAGAMAFSTFSKVGKTVASVLQHRIMPNQAHAGSGSSTMCAFGMQDFSICRKHIRAEYLRILDDYFDMFGYATNRVKTPNRSSRPHWNYVKTCGCVVRGDVPADATASISTIYDRGITFWKNPSEVGEYNHNNKAD